MRILLCNEHYCPVGGAEIYMLDVAVRLEELGHEVGVLHDTPMDPALEGRRPSFHVPGSLGFFQDQSRQAVNEVRGAVRQFSPDLIYQIQVLDPAVSQVLSEAAPVVRYVMGLRLTCPSGRRMPQTWDGICTKPFDVHCLWKAHTQLCMPRRPDTALKVWNKVRRSRQANKEFARLLLPSRYVRDLLIEGGFSTEQLEVLHLYADVDEKITANKPGRERRIVALGRLIPEKGFQCLIEALDYIKVPALLEIIGDGSEASSLRELAVKAPERHTVIFSEWLPKERIFEVFTQGRVAAVPSIWPEPFGMVGVESMAHGLPAVAFDVGGISDWLTDGKTGTLIPRKDIPAMGQALEAYLTDYDLAERHGVAGRQDVLGRFLPAHHMNRLMEVFEEVRSNSTV
ncbi:MAG: glycosyltransferase family 4 protein [Nitrospinaceae bacterium]|jgi:glycosyltransferase involved in cell wall biosynthesis|nr:glycosyltransferase family 4 protein [Nitrospinaceae bacterium]MBT4093908.1 glycosyltransferase family 4 protein [Nitrospinaceae bacterium]MBT5368233.1 glycosyltransferase family 4 protein [Nitrospinaceae bacterium]MBT6393594.1 glycosyltransferase family 4 protein [Nitrospinaceae bacterium]MBT7857290.1 glycosyltransferase family 4 protein [Nitrospinaceae bacterium]